MDNNWTTTIDLIYLLGGLSSKSTAYLANGLDKGKSSAFEPTTMLLHSAQPFPYFIIF